MPLLWIPKGRNAESREQCSHVRRARGRVLSPDDSGQSSGPACQSVRPPACLFARPAQQTNETKREQGGDEPVLNEQHERVTRGQVRGCFLRKPTRAQRAGTGVHLGRRLPRRALLVFHSR